VTDQFKKIFSKKTSGQINKNVVGSSYGRFCIKFLQNKMRDERNRFSSLSAYQVLGSFGEAVSEEKIQM
jgi:hypothetical protein